MSSRTDAAVLVSRLVPRVVADVLAAAGADRLLAVDPHTVTLKAMFAVPVEMLTAVPVLAVGLAAAVPDRTVALDLGALELAKHYTSLLRLPMAVVRKNRLTSATVHSEELV